MVRTFFIVGFAVGVFGWANQTLAASYQVFPRPIADPDDGSRSVVVDPALDGGGASPFGWHDVNGAEGPEFTSTRGNNVFAFSDRDDNDLPGPGDYPDGGGSLNFQFPLDLGQHPHVYRDAAVTNAFYWCNILHDILYAHGFDESAGNFQQNNYGHGGSGNDPLVIEVQDGGFTNGINVFTAPDGTSPRVEIALWTLTDPMRDSALSSFTLGFAYGRVMSARLVGGGGGPACLSAQESAAMWAGWSDWIGLVVTAKATDVAGTRRPVGNYVLGQPPSGGGLRALPYSTDFAINDFTYDSIKSQSSPFGTGSVWATMLWQLYWELVDEHGFNPDLYGDWSTGGNNLALRLVMDGMKVVPCSPGFVDGRNAILLADQLMTGGANRCAIWRAFAARGLGFSASQGSSASVFDGTQAFDLPPDCEPVDVLPAQFDPSVEMIISPNPTVDQATIHFDIPSAGRVRLALFDVNGALVHEWMDRWMEAGEHSLHADLSDVGSSGVFFARLSFGTTSVDRKLIVGR